MELVRTLGDENGVVPNGVDADGLVAAAFDRRSARAILGIPDDARVVGAVARLDPVKRLDLLIEAVARIEGARLVIIGEGTEHARLRQCAIACGAAERVVFAGPLPDAAQLMPAFDVFATASSREGCPLAVLEAMALGVPVVASDIAAHAELLPLRCLVPARVDAFAGMLRLAVQEPTHRESPAHALWRLANEGRVRMRYSVERMVAWHRTVYEAVGEAVAAC